MATYIGFTTKNNNQPRELTRSGASGTSLVTAPRPGKKFTLVDEALVVRDLLNAFMIKQGDKVGQPGYGTTLWTYIFEQGTADTREEIETEVRRVVAQDPRIALNTVTVTVEEHGVILELQVAFQPFNNPINLALFLDSQAGTVTIIS